MFVRPLKSNEGVPGSGSRVPRQRITPVSPYPEPRTRNPLLSFPMRLPILVGNAIRARKLIATGRRVLVALSGGPDSIALLLCMLELSTKRDLDFQIAAAHLNHGIRGTDADEDETF